MKKMYVLDTNVILTDPTSFENFEDNEVVIPLVVIEELERHKTRSDETGRNAREFSRKISKYIEEGQDIRAGIKTPRGGIVRAVSSNDFDFHYRKPMEIADDKSGDNLILSVAKELTATVETSVFLVTQDLLLQIKANAIGVKTQNYKNNRVGVSTKGELYIGHRLIDDGIGKEDVDYVHDCAKNGEVIDFSIGEEEAHPNEFVTLKDKTSGASALMRWVDGEKSFKLVKDAVVSKIAAKNKEQKFAFDLLMDPKVKLVTLVGLAGSGKTLCAIAAGLQQTLDDKRYKSMVICRPVQPLGKDIGFLPGTLEEKMEPWVAPIKDNLRFLLGADGRKSKQNEVALNMLFEKGVIEVEAMTYIRGRSIANAYMIIDEAQNLTAHELKTIITRVGEGTKIVLTGDVEQIDVVHLDSLNNGLTIAVEKFKSSPIAGHVTLFRGERSELASLAAEVL